MHVLAHFYTESRFWHTFYIGSGYFYTGGRFWKRFLYRKPILKPFLYRVWHIFIPETILKYFLYTDKKNGIVNLNIHLFLIKYLIFTYKFIN